jgi:hypothetical protein
MNLVEELAKALGLKELLVHAAPDAVGFYQQLAIRILTLRRVILEACSFTN